MLKFDPEFHIYTVNDIVYPSVTRVLQGVGLIDFTGISPDVLQRAADFGKAVHLATCLDDQGILDEDSLDQNLAPYLGAWRAFRGDMKFDDIEQPLCQPDLGLAGTPDRIAGNTIIDIKAVSKVSQVTGIQLAGYAILADLPTARRLAVQLLPTGKYVVHEFTSRQDRGVFLAALTVYQWRRNNATS